MFCPKCRSENVKIESVQENLGTTSISETKYKMKKGHGFIWWLLIGWWWSLLKIAFWPIIAIPRAIFRVGNRGVIGKSTGATESVNHIVYKTICTCQNCGKTWEVKR